MDAPVKYAKNASVHLAYRVFGGGPRDIVLVPGTLSHVEAYWERPAARYLLQRLSAFARVVVFDKFSDRGTHRLKGVPDEWHLYSVQ